MRHAVLTLAALSILGLTAQTTLAAGPSHAMSSQLAAQAVAHRGHHGPHGYHGHHGHHGHHPPRPRWHRPPVVVAPPPVIVRPPAWRAYRHYNQSGFYYGSPNFSFSFGF